jgi:hypothetical protein
MLLSVYPLIMGAGVLAEYLLYGNVDVNSYPKYLIPYAPIAVALVLSAALLPVAARYFKKAALPIISMLGIGVFLLCEIGMERVVLFDGDRLVETNVGAYQAFMCYVTPEAMRAMVYSRTIGAMLAERYNPAFKIHFYLISILIVLSVIGVAYGFAKMIRDGDFMKKRPLIVQAIAVAAFIGLCALACLTAFYRTGALFISTVSSLLMSQFFIAFGLVAGVYAGSLLYFAKPMLSRMVPALIAVVATALMYACELILMGGVVFRFGRGFLFDPIYNCPLAIVDFIVIALAGLITYFILYLMRYKK